MLEGIACLGQSGWEAPMFEAGHSQKRLNSYLADELVKAFIRFMGSGELVASSGLCQITTSVS